MYNILCLFLIGPTTVKGSSWHIVLFMLTSRMLWKREKWIKKGLPWSTLKIRPSDLVKIMAYIRHTRTEEGHNNVLNVTLNHVQRTTFMLFNNWMNISYDWYMIDIVLWVCVEILLNIHWLPWLTSLNTIYGKDYCHAHYHLVILRKERGPDISIINFVFYLIMFTSLYWSRKIDCLAA